jgi:hypothetical protein
MNNIINILVLASAYMCVFILTTFWEFNQEEWITPRWFYKYKRLNWFGSYLAFILVTICSPICLIIKMAYIIYLGIKWLITVGR